MSKAVFKKSRNSSELVQHLVQLLLIDPSFPLSQGVFLSVVFLGHCSVISMEERVLNANYQQMIDLPSRELALLEPSGSAL